MVSKREAYRVIIERMEDGHVVERKENMLEVDGDNDWALGYTIAMAISGMCGDGDAGPYVKHVLLNAIEATGELPGYMNAAAEFYSHSNGFGDDCAAIFVVSPEVKFDGVSCRPLFCRQATKDEWESLSRPADPKKEIHATEK